MTTDKKRETQMGQKNKKMGKGKLKKPNVQHRTSNKRQREYPMTSTQQPISNDRHCRELERTLLCDLGRCPRLNYYGPSALANIEHRI
jgi:hypothetical protein